MKHYNIPIFIPELACPNQCIYCNQRHISGQNIQPSKQDILEKINLYLTTFQSPCEVELAYFGGSFTGLDLNQQEAYLKIIQPYILDGKIKSIRLSTRPDYINSKILEILKKYNVGVIELGAQSLDDEILQKSNRGHSVKDVQNASEMILNYGFELGLQMMIGLPLDNIEKSLNTAKSIVSLGASNTRIYPTLVIENTALYDMYLRGEYKALSLEDAVNWTAIIYKYFHDENIKILRVGLHPSETLINKTELSIGAFHVSFRELVLTKIWSDILLNALPDINGKKLILYTNSQNKAYAIGYNSYNRRNILSKASRLVYNIDETLKGFEFRYELLDS